MAEEQLEQALVGSCGRCWWLHVPLDGFFFVFIISNMGPVIPVTLSTRSSSAVCRYGLASLTYALFMMLCVVCDDWAGAGTHQRRNVGGDEAPVGASARGLRVVDNGDRQHEASL